MRDAMRASQGASAANRFGLGAKPGELAHASSDPRGWLHQQLRAAPLPAVFAGLPDSRDILQREYDYKQARRADKKAGTGQPAPDDLPVAGNGAGDADTPRPRRRERRAAQGDGAVMQTPDMPTKDMRRDSRSAGGEDPEFRMQRRQLARSALDDIDARYRWATSTDASFVERLTRFWSNHFAVSVDKGPARLYAAPMEREAIRPHVLGNFNDLLLAVETHPAMLRYLDNVASVGADSTFATRAARRMERMAAQGNAAPKRKLGLNENLAREIMELHTLGVDGGYKQADVVEFARAITGWGTLMPRDRERGGGNDSTAVDKTGFVFRGVAHEPGERVVLGKRYVQEGQAQGQAILRDLALHPSTARHLSLKLARHFVADDPPPALVERMSQAYLGSRGDLTDVYKTLIDSPEAWSPTARKFKTPDDFVVSAMRAGGIAFDRDPRVLTQLLEHLGQPVFNPRSPAGYADTAADWMAGDGLWKRIQAAEALADRVAVAQQDPLAAAQASLGAEPVTGDFAAGLRRAGSPREGLALLFASPAFQWRT